MRTSEVSAFLRNAFPIAVGAVCVGAAVWYLGRHPEHLAAIQRLSPKWLLLLTGLSTVRLACLGGINKVILRELEINLALTEWLGLAALTAMGNYLTPFRGGALLRACYLWVYGSWPGLSFSFLDGQRRKRMLEIPRGPGVPG